MNIPLLKSTVKRNLLLFIIFLVILTLYLSIMVFMYDPENMASIKSMVNLFPSELVKAFGFSDSTFEFTGFMAGWLYGILMIVFPMVYSVLLINRLVAKPVDNGSLACYFATPVSRTKIIITWGFYALLSIGILQLLIFCIALIICSLALPGLLKVPEFFALNLTTMLVNMTVLMIVFFFACLFNESKLSVGFGTGIPVAFLLIKMLGEGTAKEEIFGKLTLFSLYDPVKITSGEATLTSNLIFCALIIILFTVGILVFIKKKRFII